MTKYAHKNGTNEGRIALSLIKVSYDYKFRNVICYMTTLSSRGGDFFS